MLRRIIGIERDKMETKEMFEREAEARKYLEEHKIMQIFNDLTATLVYHRPDNPKQLMIKEIEKVRLARSKPIYKPILLRKKNADAIFETLDPVGKGFITLKQYTETMKRLGVTGFEPFNKGQTITKELFVQQFDYGEPDSDEEKDVKPVVFKEPIHDFYHYDPATEDSRNYDELYFGGGDREDESPLPPVSELDSDHPDVTPHK